MEGLSATTKGNSSQQQDPKAKAMKTTMKGMVIDHALNAASLRC